MACGSVKGTIGGQRRGFTLVELLVVVTLLALLLAVLLPGLRRARTAARILKAHAELRGIDLALQMYADGNAGALPPTRFSCSMRTAYELPLELGRGHYLTRRRRLVVSPTGTGMVESVAWPDVFNPRETYKYRAPGAAVVNETVLLEPPDGATLWVPRDFPDCSSEEGGYYADPKECPVRYAIWSIGPDPESPKFKRFGGRMPVPSRFWCRDAGDTGVITHFQGRDGTPYQSP